tara:strand:- start:703 stop:1047 length:345 start_codon:yes stop_codon:yes gene_type:complete
MDAKLRSSRVEVAVSFLEQHCSRNGVVFYQREPKLETSADVIIVGTQGGQYGSVGIDSRDDTLKCYCRDNKQYRWAHLEGFTEEEIYTLFSDTLVKEVSLEQMASTFVGGINAG